VNAQATSSTQVSVSWTYSVPGATFKIYRENTYIGQTTATTYGDTAGGSGTAIMYKVTAVVGGTESLPAEDVAAMFAFPDYPLVAQSTLIRAAHVTVLQNAVNAVRARAGGLGAVAFPSIIPNVTIVQASHVQGLLDPLDDARQMLGLPRLFDSTTVTTGSPIRANLLNAIREAL
jgi:hypothetical protein